MAKPFWFRLFGQDSQHSLEQFWSALTGDGLADRIAGSRLFQLLAAPARSDSAATDSASVPLAADRNPVFRSPEWPAISIPANVQADLQFQLDLSAIIPAGAPTPADPGPDDLAGEPAERSATIQYGTMPYLQAAGAGAALGAGGSANYVVVLSENLEATLVYDARTKQLLTGGPGDWPELGHGADDILDLSGDFSGGFTLTRVVPGLDTIVVRPGNDYDLVATDDLVDAGQTLTISAMPLGVGDHMLFDGSAETDGRFLFFGSEGTDVFLGGAGDDRILGLGGADMLNGGGGSDTFAYTFASESSGAGYDTIGDFDPATDRIDLPGAVSGFGAAIESGSLSLASFDDDLSALLGGLASGQAVWFAPDAGDLAGTVFLIVDANGEAGYQAGEDYVFAVGGAPLVDLSGHTGFFV